MSKNLNQNNLNGSATNRDLSNDYDPNLATLPSLSDSNNKLNIRIDPTISSVQLDSDISNDSKQNSSSDFPSLADKNNDDKLPDNDDKQPNNVFGDNSLDNMISESPLEHENTLQKESILT